MGLLEISKHYANPSTQVTGEVFGHFDLVASQAMPSQLGKSIAAAMQSDATPKFGQTIGGLFGQSNPEQKAGVLNEIMHATGPTATATAAGGILSHIFGSDGGGSFITPDVTPIFRSRR